MSHCALPYKCLLSLTTASCVGCSLHTLRAITFISILTCFPCGMCVLCQSWFSSWSVCGMSVRLQCPSGHGTSASCVPTDPWLFSVSLAGMWLRDASSAQPKCLSWFLPWIYIFIYLFNFIFLLHQSVPVWKATQEDYWLLKTQWCSVLQPLLCASWLNRSMDIVKKGFLAIEKCYFSASKEEYLKIVQSCRELNWFLLKIGTNLIVKRGISPTAFQHLP